MQTHRAMPVLQVSDVEASEAFYAKLGFASHGAWHYDGAASFAIVQRGDVTLALQRTEQEVPANSHWAAYVYVSDVQALHSEFSALDLPKLTQVTTDNPYGCDDFEIVDPDGHQIAFGQDMNPVHGPGLGSERGAG